MIVNGVEEARASSRSETAKENQSSASLVVVPPALIDQWASEFRKFTTGINVIKIYDFSSLSKLTVKDFKGADVVICPVDILESKGYLEFLLKTAGLNCEEVPKLPRYSGQREQMGAVGVWIPATSADPYGGANNGNNQKYRDQSAYFTFLYSRAIQNVRTMKLRLHDQAPLEYFEWERVFIDEVNNRPLLSTSVCSDSHFSFFADSKDSRMSLHDKRRNRRGCRRILQRKESTSRERTSRYYRAQHSQTSIDFSSWYIRTNVSIFTN
jgi:SNF2 family DNA or RNA helicase